MKKMGEKRKHQTNPLYNAIVQVKLLKLLELPKTQKGGTYEKEIKLDKT
jgi:hypothetical protein